MVKKKQPVEDGAEEKKTLIFANPEGEKAHKEPKSETGFDGDESSRKKYDIVLNVSIKPADGDGLSRRITIEDLYSTREIYDPELIREALYLADKKVKVDDAQTALPV